MNVLRRLFSARGTASEPDFAVFQDEDGWNVECYVNGHPLVFTYPVHEYSKDAALKRAQKDYRRMYGDIAAAMPNDPFA